MKNWYEGDDRGPKNWNAEPEPPLPGPLAMAAARGQMRRAMGEQLPADVFHHDERIICKETDFCPACDLERKRQAKVVADAAAALVAAAAVGPADAKK